jgi:hypothetical protein
LGETVHPTIPALDPAEACWAYVGGVGNPLPLVPAGFSRGLDQARPPATAANSPWLPAPPSIRCTGDPQAARSGEAHAFGAAPMKRDARPTSLQQFGLPFQVILGHRAATALDRYCVSPLSSNRPAREVYLYAIPTSFRTFRLRPAVFTLHLPRKDYAAPSPGFP